MKAHLGVLLMVLALAAVALVLPLAAQQADLSKNPFDLVEEMEFVTYLRRAKSQFQKGDAAAAYRTVQELYNQVDKETDANRKVLRPEIYMAWLYTEADKLANADKLMALASQRARPDDYKTHLAIVDWANATGRPELAASSMKAAEAARAAAGAPDVAPENSPANRSK